RPGAEPGAGAEDARVVGPGPGLRAPDGRRLVDEAPGVTEEVRVARRQEAARRRRLATSGRGWPPVACPPGGAAFPPWRRQRASPARPAVRASLRRGVATPGPGTGRGPAPSPCARGTCAPG